MEWGTFATDGWSSPPVWIAQTFRQRWKGLRPKSAGHGMLIKGGAVHGFGMREPLLAIGLDDWRRVVGLRILHPRRAIRIRRAEEILELPVGALPPQQGAVLTWAGGGSVDLVCDTHRQPE